MASSNQMDINVFFFDEGFSMYSQSIRHATYKDTLNDFQKAHQGMEIVSKFLQVSIDGLYVK